MKTLEQQLALIEKTRKDLLKMPEGPHKNDTERYLIRLNREKVVMEKMARNRK